MSTAGIHLSQKAAVIGARAAWSLSLWGEMEAFTAKLPADNVDANFMKAVLAVHAENYSESARYIEQTRRQLDKSMTSLLAESYTRSYVPFIMLQQCSELEEITAFKMLSTELKNLQKQCEQPQQATVSSRNTATTFLGPSATSIYASSVITGTVSVVSVTQPSSIMGSSNTSAASAAAGICWSGSSANRLALLSQQLVDRKAFLSHKWRQRIRGCCSSGLHVEVH